MSHGKIGSKITISSLYVDIVGHTAKQPGEDPKAAEAARNGRVRRLNVAVDEVLRDLPSDGEWPVRSFTGDGVILVFRGDATVAAEGARFLAGKLRPHGPSVRMGIHTGAVIREDLPASEPRLMGSGMDLGERVMSFGEGAHILLSGDAVSSLRNDELRRCCHDLGRSKAKHGTWVELHNFFGNDFGNEEVPDKLRRADDGWERPATLRLSKARSRFTGVIDTLRWLIFAPQVWAEEVSRIDPRLCADFSIVELTPLQFRSNPDLRALLARCAALPVLLLVVVLAVFSVFGKELQIHPGSIFALLATSGFMLASIVGVGASLVFFFISSIGEMMRQLAIARWGQGSAPEMLVMALCQLVLVLVLAPVLQRGQLARKSEEMLGILAGLAGCLTFLVALGLISGLTVRALSGQALPRPLVALGAIAIFSLTTMLVTRLRTRSWPHAYTVGRIAGILFGVVYAMSFFASGPNFEPTHALPNSSLISWPQALGVGASIGLSFGVLAGVAFVCGRLVADGVAGLVAAALQSGLMVVSAHAAAALKLKGTEGLAPLTLWHLLPIAAVLLGWGAARFRLREGNRVVRGAAP
jgi:class 3 adenylate cyclase